MSDKKDFVVCSADAVEREGKQERHSDGGKFAIPKIVFLPVCQEMCKTTTCGSSVIC